MFRRTCIPAARDSSISAGKLRERRLRGLHRSLLGLVAKDADHVAELLERGLRRRADHAGGFGDLFGRGVGAELERAGVHAQQREPVGEDVVHLPRDPPALGLPGLLDAKPLLGFEPLGPLAQRADELAPRAGEEPPAERTAISRQPKTSGSQRPTLG